MRNAPPREPPPARTSVISLTVAHGAELGPYQTPLLRPWAASLYLESHGAPTLLLGSSVGFLADLRSGGDAVADQLDLLVGDTDAMTALLRRTNRALSRHAGTDQLRSLVSDTEAMSALLRRTDGVLSPHTRAHVALLIQHVTLEPWCRRHELGPHFATKLIDAFLIGQDGLPILLVPKPPGWAEMLPTARRIAQADAERFWARIGFARHQDSDEVWWLEGTALRSTAHLPADQLARLMHAERATRDAEDD
ncbi:hypothetical protein [Georgenia thermotolerans]|uniref:Uncharacterized protein n=1 Tax=Georgenia thermotolerans TaxID=527326 RepID=A0A7J5UR90_9MICO|nr:hypothetical protein [Georgenia thermotolerans]KAE8764847.1 hypothetical protein GB883_06900 [Georgenia thermotolerans]